MEIILLLTSIIVIIIIAITKIVRENKTKRENRIVRFVDNFFNQYSSKKDDQWGFITFIECDIIDLKNHKEINEVAKRVQNRTSKKTDLLELIPNDIRNSPDLKQFLLFIREHPQYKKLTAGEIRGTMTEMVENFKKSKNKH